MPNVERILAWVEGVGPWGPVLFVLAYVAACVLLIPGSVLTLGAGAVFGFSKGLVLVLAGANLGASAAFLLGRTAARGWVARKLESRPAFKAIDQAVGREGGKMVLLLRLSPVFPFILLNYALGVTAVSWRAFAAATLVGIVPATAAFVYVGSIAGTLAQGGVRSRTPGEWAVLALGLAATVAVSVIGARIARRAMREAGLAAPGAGA